MAATAQPIPPRATQGFIGTLTWTWRRPLLTLIEIAWRWLYGVPAIWLCFHALHRILDDVPWRATGIERVSANAMLTDPMAVSQTLATFAALVMPGVRHAAVILGPSLLGGWVLLSAAGRALLFQRMEPALRPRFRSLLALQAIRLLPLLLAALLWWAGVQALAHATIEAPMLAGGEPQIMGYVGGVIVLSLTLFVVTSAVGWIFTLAPLLSMRNRTGVFRSLRDAVRVPGLRGSLVEINLVLSVVKIMLLVLALAFSAFPLPFASVITTEYVLLWSALVSLWYCAASDLFHVARITGYLRALGAIDVTEAE